MFASNIFIFVVILQSLSTPQWEPQNVEKVYTFGTSWCWRRVAHEEDLVLPCDFLRTNKNRPAIARVSEAFPPVPGRSEEVCVGPRSDSH